MNNETYGRSCVIDGRGGRIFLLISIVPIIEFYTLRIRSELLLLLLILLLLLTEHSCCDFS